MSIKATIDRDVQLVDVTGYRLAAVLQQGGAYTAALQFVTEQRTVYNPANGLGRGSVAANVTAGNLPAVDNQPHSVTFSRPLQGNSNHEVQTQNFHLSSIDRRVVGEWGITFLEFRSLAANWVVNPATLRPAESLQRLSSGMLSFAADGHFNPLLDIDSSGQVLSWRALRSAANDPLAWMNAAAGHDWTLTPYFKWDPNIAAQQFLPNGNPAAIVFEELCGRFISRRRLLADELETAFLAKGGVNPDGVLFCNLDDIVPLPRGREPMPEFQLGQDIQERVSVIYNEDVNFPRW